MTSWETMGNFRILLLRRLMNALLDALLKALKHFDRSELARGHEGSLSFCSKTTLYDSIWRVDAIAEGLEPQGFVIGVGLFCVWARVPGTSPPDSVTFRYYSVPQIIGTIQHGSVCLPTASHVVTRADVGDSRLNG
jgi:hypothetical protein